jgi:muramoyltetrapeptide carboxypeptidase
MMIRTPAYLMKGDTIGIVCPSGYMVKERTDACVRTLETWGYKIKLGKTVGGSSENYFSGTDDERLDDFQEMLDDEEVKAILFGRGGYGMTRIIDRISFKKFRQHPKWIIGYSDITILHTHLYSNFYISSLHSPMAGAFNDEGYKNEYIASFKNVIEGKKINYRIGTHPFNRRGEAVGELVGGNLTLLAHACGSESDLKTKGKILFLEDIGEYLYNIDRMFWQLKRAGKLSKLAGLIIGGFTDLKDTERPFGKTIYEIIKEHIDPYNYPVCFDFPVSHTDKNYALKIGCGYKLKVGKTKVSLEE